MGDSHIPGDTGHVVMLKISFLAATGGQASETTQKDALRVKI